MALVPVSTPADFAKLLKRKFRENFAEISKRVVHFVSEKLNKAEDTKNEIKLNFWCNTTSSSCIKRKEEVWCKDAMFESFFRREKDSSRKMKIS